MKARPFPKTIKLSKDIDIQQAEGWLKANGCEEIVRVLFLENGNTRVEYLDKVFDQKDILWG